MFSLTTGQVILILLIVAPFYFWYIYLPILLIGILLLCFNRKKRENETNRFYYKVGKFLIGFIIVSLIISLLSILCLLNS